MSLLPTLMTPGASSAGDDAAAQWRAAQSAAVVAEETGLAELTINGPDAADFLQGQLSNDVKKLQPGQGQWTTFNSPKGRMLATLFLAREDRAEGYVAILAHDVADAVRKRLSMFVLRAKVQLSLSASRVLGVGGPRAAHAVQAALGDVPASSTLTVVRDLRIVHWPDGRVLVIAPASKAADALEALRGHATPAGPQVWSWLGVRAGVPMVTTPTQDLFVAQTANWDALGALDFRKGCYTGQEIVARTQHLGRLKERLCMFRTEGEVPAPATRLYGEPFGDQAAGTVVNSAPDPDGGAVFLAVAQIQAADAGSMSIGAPGGPRAAREALPYALPDPAPPRGRPLR